MNEKSIDIADLFGYIISGYTDLGGIKLSIGFCGEPLANCREVCLNPDQVRELSEWLSKALKQRS